LPLETILNIKPIKKKIKNKIILIFIILFYQKTALSKSGFALRGLRDTFRTFGWVDLMENQEKWVENVRICFNEISS
jgi:hypothetical protein